MRIPVDTLQAIFFDLDGTLADSDDLAAHKLARQLRFLGDERAQRWARWVVMKVETPGNAFITLLDLLGLDRLVLDLPRQMRRRPPAPFQLIPGVAEMVHALAGRYRLALVTTRGRGDLDRFLAQYPDIAPLFEFSCGRDDVGRLKPHPAPILWTAQQMGIDPSRCLMVGDTTVDIQAARRANAWSAGVLCGFGEEKELRRAQAHHLLRSTADLGNWLAVERAAHLA